MGGASIEVQIARGVQYKRSSLSDLVSRIEPHEDELRAFLELPILRLAAFYPEETEAVGLGGIICFPLQRWRASKCP